MEPDYERGWQDAITHLSPPGTLERSAANVAVTALMRRFSDALGFVADDMDRVRRTMEALDVEPDEARRVENAAWASVYLHGEWRFLTQQMTAEEREAAARAVERDWKRMNADEPRQHDMASFREALRWWET